MALKIDLVQGKFFNYSQVYVDDGYCFYDIDEPEDVRSYMTTITTPITDLLELKRKYIVVQGHADQLNTEAHETIGESVEV